MPHAERTAQQRGACRRLGGREVRVVALVERALEGDDVVPELLVQEPHDARLHEVGLAYPVRILSELDDALALEQWAQELEVIEPLALERDGMRVAPEPRRPRLGLLAPRAGARRRARSKADEHQEESGVEFRARHETPTRLRERKVVVLLVG